MGCCCSLFGNPGGTDDKDTEMQTSAAPEETEAQLKALAISRPMSAPTIKVDGRIKLSGSGLALAAVSVEQDSAYWEWHVELPEKTHVDDVFFGVATKKKQDFYEELKEEDEDNYAGTYFISQLSND
jgi:hypothetical protein